MADGNRTEEKRGEMYDHILKYTGVFGGVQGLITLVNLIRTKIVAVLLGTVGFGINDSFNKTLNLVRSTTDLGIPFSAVRDVSANHDNENTAFLRDSVLVTRSWALLTAIAGALLCIVLSPLFSLWAFDGDRGYTLSFILLSPSVAFSTIAGGEMAVLKGMRKLKEIALSQLFTVLLSLCISIPVFYYLRLRGLVLSLVLVSFATMVLTCMYSFRAMPYRVRVFSGAVLRSGADMVRLGIFFTLAAFFGSGAFSVIANYLMKNAGAELLGAYSAGYALMNYLGMFVFSAMESDYFPRLSSSVGDRQTAGVMLNRQAEVSLLLIMPMIVCFLVFLDPIVRLLLSDKFCVAIPMARIAVLSLFFKAMTQPMAYLSLAKGDSRTYLIQEFLYDIFLVVAVIFCYRFRGLEMTGFAITLAGIFDLVVVGTIVRLRYGLHLTRDTWLLAAALLLPMLLTYFSVSFLNGWLAWTVSLLLLAVAVVLSCAGLKRRTVAFDAIMTKLRKKLGR